MELNLETKRILSLVRQKTGREIEMVADPSLQVLAKAKMATGKLTAHVIVYNPNKKAVDYSIAYECGFILRLYESPEEQRLQFASTEAGRKAIRQLVTAPGGIAKRMSLPDPLINQFTEQLFGGLMTQLRSVPIGMRIDQWLWEDYPGLRELQKVSIASQQQENVQGLSPKVKAMAPTQVFNANVSMNAAYASFCDRLLGHSLYLIPYRSAGEDHFGKRLMEIWDSVPADAQHDRQLVDAWAEELELSGWYQWV